MSSSPSGVVPKTGGNRGACAGGHGVCEWPGANVVPRGTGVTFDTEEAAPNNGGVMGRRALEAEGVIPKFGGGAAAGTKTGGDHCMDGVLVSADLIWAMTGGEFERVTSGAESS